MKKIALSVPPSPFLDDDMVFPPLGVLYLKSFLEERGEIIVDLYDSDEWLDFQGEDYDFVGFSCTTPQYYSNKSFFKKIKEKYITILGGAHPTFSFPANLEEEFDFVVKGDGEKKLLSIITADSIERSDLKREEMNCSPLPYRSKEFLERYRYSLKDSHSLDRKVTTIMTSRGCPNFCGFCEHANSKLRLYDVSRVKEEIDQCVDCGFSAIMFFDDIFTMNSYRLTSICRHLYMRGVIYRCFSHVNHMTEDKALVLADSGCVEVGVGIESGSQKILDNVFKGVQVKDAYKFVEICNRASIRVKAFLMIGLPGETKGTIAETEAFIRDSGINDFDLTIYYPYEGTFIRDNIQDFDLLLDRSLLQSFGFYKGKKGFAECCVATKGLSSNDILLEKNRIFHQYKNRS